jgi:hypothetical protein
MRRLGLIGHSPIPDTDSHRAPNGRYRDAYFQPFANSSSTNDAGMRTFRPPRTTGHKSASGGLDCQHPDIPALGGLHQSQQL